MTLVMSLIDTERDRRFGEFPFRSNIRKTIKVSERVTDHVSSNGATNNRRYS